VDALRLEDRAEQERPPDDFDSGVFGQTLDAHSAG